MKPGIKIIRGVVLAIASVIAVLFSLSLILQSRGDIFLYTLNNNISTKVETGSFRISLLRKFPRASLELKDVMVHSSPGFDAKSFADSDTDTLLSARSLLVVFSMTDLIFGRYTVNRIVIKEANINLLTDAKGKKNHDIYWKGSKESDTAGGITLDLKKIILSDVKSVYNDLSSNIIIDGLINGGQLKTRISGNDIDFSAETELKIDLLKLDNLNFHRSFMADVDLNLQKTDSGVSFTRGNIRIEEWDFLISGFVSSDKNIDLDIKGNNIELSKINLFFPPEYQNAISSYRPSGKLDISGKIKSPDRDVLPPCIDLTFSLDNASVKHEKSRLSIDELSVNGKYTKGSDAVTANGQLSIQDFTCRFGSAIYTGSLVLSDFNRPSADIKLNGTIYPAELKEFFQPENISEAKGSVKMNLRFSGRLNKKDKYSLSDFLSLSSGSEIEFNSLSLGFRKENLRFEDVRGTLLLAGKSLVRDMSLLLNGQRIKVDGEITNLPAWLAGNPVDMAVNGNIYSQSLRPESFRKETTSVNNKPNILINFPENIVAEINFTFDTIRYKSFTGTDILGSFSYKPGMANFKSFTMNSQSGSISGNGLIAQDLYKSVMGRGSFVMSGIDVNETFNTFRNFGQDFIRAENLAGTLSGTLSLLIPLDSMLKPVINSVIAEGKYVLAEGALINFEPVKQLSNFIELSELENIRFNRLENDFFIRESYFYIPQMDVRSSAANLSVNGKHGFDNNYEYHVKVQLSELLSKKAVKRRGPVTEFGVIEDDGEGGTSLLLKVENQGNATKVSYDVKAATDQIRNDIRNERQNLNTAMGTEYYMDPDDTAAQVRTDQKPRFRITWGEEVKSESEIGTENEQRDTLNILRNILRRKR